MEYLSKSEVLDYLSDLRKEMVIQGKEGGTVTEIINHLNGLYTFRPLLQATWIKKRDFISCSRCGFKTLIYKNTKYCPNCGRNMANGKAVT